jgi:hypothetical protein
MSLGAIAVKIQHERNLWDIAVVKPESARFGSLRPFFQMAKTFLQPVKKHLRLRVSFILHD